MRRALELQGFACETAGNVGDPSGATVASKRPDLMLFLSYILMFKVRVPALACEHDASTTVACSWHCADLAW